LAFIIHATLKLACILPIHYPPFFLIDEVALSLDETRKKAVFNYLLNLAKENGWFVISTELGNESEITVSPLKGL
jgi:ABC-type Mn2+/Zn2+ transport system ATPase subunit